MDEYLLAFVNQHAGVSAIADGVLREVSSNILFKGVVVAIVLNWLWYRDDGNSRQRAGIVAALAVACCAVLIGRVLALTLPFSLRPIHTLDAPLNMPIGMHPSTLDGWSSLPSDHAVMYVAIAVSVFQISRSTGTFLLAHAIFLICLPRIFLGLHWPSDILVGALVGLGVALLLQPLLTRMIEEHGLVGRWSRREDLFYPVFFLVNLQIATMFGSMRDLLGGAGKLFAALL